jgi:hypothetical protein
VAIEQALTVLSWYENVTKDEVPPEYLWEDPTGLEQWWASVQEKRDSAFGGGSGGTSAAGKDDSPPEMAENDLARTLKG